jgi:hypothetical protein
MFATIIIIAVVAVIGGALYLLGSPSAERARSLDARRIDDLRGLQLAADVYWTRHRRLPSSMQELVQQPGSSISPRDPEVDRPYEYRQSDAKMYELCATFDGSSAGVAGFWSHGAGRQCFQLNVRESKAYD